jgi:hypothetical protein
MEILKTRPIPECIAAHSISHPVHLEVGRGQIATVAGMLVDAKVRRGPDLPS